MASFNSVTMMGNLVRDPELRYTTTQKAVCTFAIAVNGWQKDAPADFFSVVAWSGTAELISKYCKKGSCVLVAGELHNRKYTGRDGTEKQITEITAREVRFLASGSGGQNQRPEENPQTQPKNRQNMGARKLVQELADNMDGEVITNSEEIPF